MSKRADGNTVKLGFEREPATLRLDQIVPLKIMRPGTKQSKKYAQILSSIRAMMPRFLTSQPRFSADP